ncbi:hypothetical protein C8J56DRAFT_1034552, partial [Mycena floridula]
MLRKRCTICEIIPGLLVPTLTTTDSLLLPIQNSICCRTVRLSAIPSRRNQEAYCRSGVRGSERPLTSGSLQW